MPRKPDRVEVFHDEGTFDRFERLEVVNDIAGPAEAIFEMGDDGAWPTLKPIVEPGSKVSIYLNGRPRIQGRAEVDQVPVESGGGVRVQLTVRTKMADARYASADPSIRIKDTSVKDFVLACYAPLGITADLFVFRPFAERDLMTGKEKGQEDLIDFEAIKEDQAKIKPPETIFDAVERHLRRFRATHWDGSRGTIIVGRPGVEQQPLYRLQAKRGAASKGNNVLGATYVRDWSELARLVNVYGGTPGREVPKSGLRGEAIDVDVDAAFQRTGHFNRRVIIQSQQVTNQQQADQQAQRELSSRKRRKSAFDVLVDGWTYWTGSEQVPYVPNTTADVDVDVLGGVQGRFFITRTQMSLTADAAATTRLTLVAPESFQL